MYHVECWISHSIHQNYLEVTTQAKAETVAWAYHRPGGSVSVDMIFLDRVLGRSDTT